MMYICYHWFEEEKLEAWGIHDGINYLKVHFKTRKLARKYCEDNGIEYHK